MEAYVAVVGSVNVDICGRSAAPLIARDSNPGTVRLSLGGVGRNIACNLSLLGVPVKLLTAVAGDAHEARVRADCAAFGLDLRHALPVPDGATSTYVFLTGPDGDMALAVCDAALAERITPAYLETVLPVLNGAAAVVLETNLTAEAIAWLAEHVTAPLWADTVSVTKAEKLRPVLGKLFTLKPNRLEAELLSGVKITDWTSMELAVSALLKTGLRRVNLSLGAEGVYCAWDNERARVPCPPTKLVNATGGGDAMMAGFLRAELDRLPIEQAARFALACSSLAVECPETVNRNLSYIAAKERNPL